MFYYYYYFKEVKYHLRQGNEELGYICEKNPDMTRDRYIIKQQTYKPHYYKNRLNYPQLLYNSHFPFLSSDSSL